MFDGLKSADDRGGDVPKTKLLKTSMRHQFNEFFDHSTLHGIRYIAQNDRPLHERFMWFSFLSVGIVITSIIIISLWEKFQTSPTITGLDTDFHNWDVQFPAITICPLQSTSDEKVVYHCEDLMFDCTFKGEPYNCCSGFEPIFTEYGFCYSFNSRHVVLDWPWKPENYSKSGTEYVYETDNKLSITFNTHNTTKNPLNIFIHSTDDILVIDTLPQHLWTRRIARILFDSKQTYTTEGARQLSIKQRKCVFPDEIPLLTDHIYTFSACMIQCRMDTSRALCGCVSWFYKTIDGYKYCDLKGLVCISKHLDKILNGLACPCKLGCMNTVYEVEKLQDAQADIIDKPLEITFVSWPMVRYRREVLFGWVDLLVAFGGIAGLFLGFSLLSGVEILYYFTMRAFCMVAYNPKALEELSKDYENQDKPVIDLGLKPLWTRTENKGTDVTRKNDKKKEAFVLPFLH
ncbi:sodium channel protein Nach-like isoform X2 [Sipha flava]|uniref:Sodium channel protein Nach-like isoform X2 n=1 Tax=Sipha flava TaxID=143950 RepID=A0A8B8G1C5_9HEMI|nr:sodium channel protein Nach-like isoform X2 [Sipha flava]